jgi:dihydrofolate reductase
MINNIPVTIVAGMGRNTRIIGNNNQLLWHVPADLKRFKELTLGKPIIMGRKTFESILAIIGKPLPGRTNIVVTRQTDYIAPEGVKVVASLKDAFAVASSENPSEIHIGGGAELYKQALPFVDKLHVTWFNDDSEGDTTFPEFEKDFEIETAHEVQTHDGLEFQWVDYKRPQNLI